MALSYFTVDKLVQSTKNGYISQDKDMYDEKEIIQFRLNRTHCGDAAKMLAELPDACVDLTVTSPPYDDMGADFVPIPKKGMRKYDGYQWDFMKIAKQLYRVTEDGGIVVWIVAPPTVGGSESLVVEYQKIFFRECGFKIHDTMIYRTEGLTMNHNRYEQETEYMIVLVKGNIATFNPIMVPCKWYGRDSDRTGTRYSEHDEPGTKRRSGKLRNNIHSEKIKGNVWKYVVGGGHTTKDKYTRPHPARFPEALARDHILSWSHPGDLVLDPFSGSGTTGKMAVQLGRQFLGFEISQKYCDMANRRIKGANLPLL